MKKILLSALMISATISTFAICQGTSTEHDATYYNGDPNHKDWVSGYNYSMKTVGADVIITFASLDNFEGAAAPYIFLNPGTEKFKEVAMQGTYNNATATINGYHEGDILSFMFKLPVAGGCAYSKVLIYTFGSECGEGEGGGIEGGEDMPETACSGTSTELDAFFTEHDGAACKSLEKGYTYEFKTTSNGVEFKMNFLDQFVGFAAPYAFVFTSETDVNLHDEVALQNAGQLVYGTFTGYAAGQSLKILVKIAYAEHVLFTKRLTYVVGTECAEPMGIEEQVVNSSSVNSKYMKNGQLIIVRDGVEYNAIGMQL